MTVVVVERHNDGWRYGVQVGDTVRWLGGIRRTADGGLEADGTPAGHHVTAVRLLVGLPAPLRRRRRQMAT